MQSVSSKLRKDLEGLLERKDLVCLAEKLKCDPSFDPFRQQSVEFGSTKTSLLTTTMASPNLRRPIRSKNSRRGQSPVQPQFSKTIFTSSLQPVKHRAIFYKQDNDLPNLHSLDLLQTLYNREDEQQQNERKWNSHRKFENINRALTASDLTNLKELQFFCCNIESLRNLGTGWKVRSLTLIGGIIQDLAGISGFSLIQDLFVSYNRITDLSQLSYHQTLKAIDLQGNLISDPDQIDYLATVEFLEYVNLDHNPIMHEPLQKRKIQETFQHKLDNEWLEPELDCQDLWLSYQNNKQANLAHLINSQLIKERQNSTNEVIKILQQPPTTKKPQQFSIYQTQPQQCKLKELTAFHTYKRTLNDQVMIYINSKMSPQNIIVGSRSRSKNKLQSIQSKEKLLQTSATLKNNESQMRETKQSFRSTIREEAKKKFMIRKGSIRNEHMSNQDGIIVTESLRLRPGRSLLKSCLNKL